DEDAADRSLAVVGDQRAGGYDIDVSAGSFIEVNAVSAIELGPRRQHVGPVDGVDDEQHGYAAFRAITRRARSSASPTSEQDERVPQFALGRRADGRPREALLVGRGTEGGGGVIRLRPRAANAAPARSRAAAPVPVSRTAAERPWVGNAADLPSLKNVGHGQAFPCPARPSSAATGHVRP